MCVTCSMVHWLIFPASAIISGDDPARKDLLMEIGVEELSDLEIVGTLARMHLTPMKSDGNAAEADPLVAITGGE